jgi:enolase
MEASERLPSITARARRRQTSRHSAPTPSWPSLAIARAAADGFGLPLYTYLGGVGAGCPCRRRHQQCAADNGIDFQIHAGAAGATRSQCAADGSGLPRAQEILQSKLSTGVGTRRLRAHLASNTAALDLLMGDRGWPPAAATWRWRWILRPEVRRGQQRCRLPRSVVLNADEMVAAATRLVERYPHRVDRDGLGEDDWADRR